MKPQVIYGFTFFNELELFPLKIEELWDVVDTFLVVESPLTFSGMKKPMTFWENRHRFEKYFSKISYVNQSTPIGNDPWVREKYQRDIILSLARYIYPEPSTVLINSDMDEIVSRVAVEAWLAGATDFRPTAMMEKMYYYYLNNLADCEWAGGKIMKLHEGLPQTLSELRYNDNLPIIQHGGWHFSFLGGVQRIKEKVLSYAHNDLYPFVADTTKLEADIRTGKDWFSDRNMQFRQVPIDETYPKYILDNLSLWKDFIME